MADDARRQRDMEFQKRLLEFVKGELRELWVEARIQFTIDIMRYLQPEIQEVMRHGKEEGA